MAAHLDQQAAGREVLVVVSVIEEHRTRQAGVHLFHFGLPARGKAEVLAEIRQVAAVVRAADDHHLCRRLPVDISHGLDACAVLALDGVAVDVQHDFDARILLKVRAHGRVALFVAAVVARVIVQRRVVQRRDARGVQLSRDALAHGHHVDGRVRTARGERGIAPALVFKFIRLGGVRVHDEHLRFGRADFNLERQRLPDLGGDLRGGERRAVLDAARSRRDVLPAGALLVVDGLEGSHALGDRFGLGSRFGRGGIAGRRGGLRIRLRGGFLGRRLGQSGERRLSAVLRLCGRGYSAGRFKFTHRFKRRLRIVQKPRPECGGVGRPERTHRRGARDHRAAHKNGQHRHKRAAPHTHHLSPSIVCGGMR